MKLKYLSRFARASLDAQTATAALACDDVAIAFCACCHLARSAFLKLWFILHDYDFHSGNISFIKIMNLFTIGDIHGRRNF